MKHPEGYPNLTVNQRVRFRSENPKQEPTATIIEVGYNGVRLEWDDGHHPTLVLQQRLNQLEVLDHPHHEQGTTLIPMVIVITLVTMTALLLAGSGLLQAVMSKLAEVR